MEEQYAVIEFVDYTFDRDIGDRAVFISREEYEELKPYEHKLSNGTWGACSMLVGECLDRDEAESYPDDTPTIEVAIC